MTEEDRRFLTRLCAQLEEHFPNVIAGFEGFAHSYLGGERDGFLAIEVFNVTVGQADELQRMEEDLTEKHFLGGGALVAVSTWTPEETREHFAADVAILGVARDTGFVVAEVHIDEADKELFRAAVAEGRVEEIVWTRAEDETALSWLEEYIKPSVSKKAANGGLALAA